MSHGISCTASRYGSLVTETVQHLRGYFDALKAKTQSL